MKDESHLTESQSCQNGETCGPKKVEGPKDFRKVRRPKSRAGVWIAEVRRKEPSFIRDPCEKHQHFAGKNAQTFKETEGEAQ